MHKGIPKRKLNCGVGTMLYSTVITMQVFACSRLTPNNDVFKKEGTISVVF